MAAPMQTRPDENARLEAENARLEAENAQLSAEVAELSEQLLAIEEARDRYADLYDFVSVACLTLDRNGAITEANRRTVSLVRHDRRRLLGVPLMTLVVPQHRRQFLDHLLICKKGVDAVTLDLALQPSEGKPIPVRVTIRYNPELGGGYAVAAVDMRAILSAEAEQRRSVAAARAAQAANQVKTRLIASLGVELRGLLGAVLQAGRVVSASDDLTHELRAPLAKLLDTISALRRRVVRIGSARRRPGERVSQQRLDQGSVPRFRATR
jgi:PAS domain-containing protein